MANCSGKHNRGGQRMVGDLQAKHDLAAPSPWVVRFIGGVAAGGTVLDVACGRGRHLRLALDRGHKAVGIDRDLSGLADLKDPPGLELIAADLEDGRPFPLLGKTFDGVIVANYLWRPVLPDIVASVGRGGILIYETFAVGNERLGKPANPDFLLRPGELLTAVAPRLTAIAFEHVKLSDPPRIVQRVAAVGPDHAWLNDPPPL
jgi:SAM-dependent methyltransferase